MIRQLTFLCSISLILSLNVAYAAVPVTVAVEGQLTSGGGAAAADGTYDLSLALYSNATTLTPLWSETAKVKVSAGRFSHALGSVKPLDPKTVSGGQLWFGLKVGTDPELPRQPLRSSITSLRAAVADGLGCTNCVQASAVGFTYAGSATKGGAASDLACTGCVSVKEMKFDGDVDLGSASIKAQNGVFKGNVVAQVMSAQSFQGDGSKLTGVQVAGGQCKAGEAVVSILADGSVKCAAAGSSTNSALGGQLSTVFTETAKIGALPVAIPDNTGSEAVVQAVYGKVGVATSFVAEVALTNTDLSTLRLQLLPPWDKVKGFTVCDPCGAKDAKSYTVKLTETSKIKSGDLSSVLGKSLEGNWTLKVLDSSFCLGQVAANKGICDVNAKTDGKLSKFMVSATVNSSQSVKVAGTVQFGLLTQEPFVCEAARVGHAYFDLGLKRLRFCDGSVWRSLSDTCGNGVLETGEDCDDGNNTDGDGCSKTCIADYGYGPNKPGLSCKDILNKVKDAPNGPAWIKPTNYTGKSFQVWCDMTTNGGGWTLVGKTSGKAHNADNGVLDGHDSTRWKDKKYLGEVFNLKQADALGPAYESVAFTDFMLMGLNDTTKKMAWRMPKSFTSLWAAFNSNKTEKTTTLLVGNHKTLDYRPGCGAGNGPDGTGPQFYGFNIPADSGNTSGQLFNGFNGGWCESLAGWGRNNTTQNWAGGGLGANCEGRSHQMGRHYWGYGDGCNSSGWSNKSNLNAFYGHAFFVR